MRISENCDPHNGQVQRSFSARAEEQINVAANITVLTEKQKAFRTSPEQYIAKFSIPEEYLKQQFIPVDHELWKTDNYELFISERAKLLCSAINAYFQNLKSSAS